MKKVVYLCMVLILVTSVLLAGCKSAPSGSSGTAAPSGEAVEIKISIDLPPQDPFAVAAEALAATITERTNGQYKVTVYAGGTLTAHGELFDMMKSGAIEMGEAPIEYQAAADIRFSAVQLPFMLDDMAANNIFSNLMNERLYNPILAEKFNVMPLATFTTGMHQYNGTKKAVKTLDDWKGLLLWTANPVAANTATALGASPVNLDFWDGYPALQKGTVDAGICSHPLAVSLFEWYDAVRNITICNIFGSTSNLFISLDVFNAMTPEVQKIFTEECSKFSADMANLFIGIQQESLTALEGEGVAIYQLPADERDKWREATKSVYDDYFSQLDPADVQIIKDCAAEANK